MSLEILTSQSPRWYLFGAMLSDMLQGDLPEGKWRCGNDGSGGSMHRYTEALLKTMGGIDIVGTLDFFRKHGGHCDCEVLFNVEHDDDDGDDDGGGQPVPSKLVA
jgi:hypothetical protein